MIVTENDGRIRQCPIATFQAGEASYVCNFWQETFDDKMNAKDGGFFGKTGNGKYFQAKSQSK